MAGKRALIIVATLVALNGACGNAPPSGPMTPPSEVTSTAAPPEPTATLTLAPAFEVSGINYYEDPVGSLRFLLEVRNLNDFALEDVRATVCLSEAEGRIMYCQSGYARLDLVNATDTAPILVVFFLNAPAFSDYEVTIEGRRADYLAGLLHRHLHIVEDVVREGQWVPYEVLGRVNNTGTESAESVSLVVTCYDTDGKVVAVATGRPTETTLSPGASSDFLVSIGAVADEIASCRVQAEGLVSSDG